MPSSKPVVPSTPTIMTKQERVSPLFQNALKSLLDANKVITVENVSDVIVKTHGPHCRSWKHISSECLQRYICFCLKDLKMTNLNCEAVAILHEYLGASNQIYPTSQEQLVHFNECGTVRTENLDRLCEVSLSQKAGAAPLLQQQCCLCKKKLMEGECVILLPCAHYCCNQKDRPPLQITCNIRSWLSVTNRCPQCDCCIQL